MTAIRTSLQNAFETQLSAEMGPNSLVADVDSIGILTSPCYICIDMESDSLREYIYFDGSFGAASFLTTNIANRYLPGSAAGSNLTHALGAFVRVVPMAQHIEDLHDRIDAVTHGSLDGLSNDDHAQYPLVDGSRAFTGEVAGVTPTAAASLARKDYVDAAVGAYRGVRAYRSSTLSVPNTGETVVEFNTENFDTDTIHDNSTNPSRFTVPAGMAGKWLIKAQIRWTGGGTGNKVATLKLNGSTALAQDHFQDALFVHVNNVSTVELLSVSDYIELFVSQNDSGGNNTVGSGRQHTFLVMTFLGA